MKISKCGGDVSAKKLNEEPKKVPERESVESITDEMESPVIKPLGLQQPG